MNLHVKKRSVMLASVGASFALALSNGVALAQAADAKAAAPTPGTYVLGDSDVVEISVLSHPDYTTRGRISPDGTISLPFIGRVQAAGRTASIFADEISAALEKGGYFSKPITKVEIVSFASRYVTVLGSVLNPGLIPIDRTYRLSEIIARVGGIRETGASYIAYRPADGALRQISIASLATGDGKDDPIVGPGDKIYSPPAEMFYVSGQAKAPGAYVIMPGMTIRMAISRGGGPTDLGSENKLTLTRKGKRLTRVDLDDAIEAGDVIVLGEKLF